VSYRSPSLPDEPEDPEAKAIAELGRRSQRTRRAVFLPVLLLGIVVGIVGYVVLRLALLELLGAHVPWLTGALTLAPAFMGSIRLAVWLADAVVARRSPRWRSELARAHGLDEKLLEETTQFA
jgi:H+/Cl- antiporter ClcA